ncbi:hypothetical protein HK102_008073 [Quaeritorhiza haematococci]|nr:hypothetical protein HK102_008073 [Quaeritorhiza haematococci]
MATSALTDLLTKFPSLIFTYAPLIIVIAVLYLLYIKPFVTPLRQLPGPTFNPLLALGAFPTILKEEAGIPQLRWAKEYGGIYMYRFLFNEPRIVVTDSKMLSQVFGAQAQKYQRSEDFVRGLQRILGKGLLATTGAEHKRQRALVNPAFLQKYIIQMTPIFARTALELRDAWKEIIESSPDKKTTFGIYAEMSKVTLDIIGRAGFGHEFNAVTNANNALYVAYQNVFSQSGISVRVVLENFFPILRRIPTEGNRKRLAGRATLDRTVQSLIDERRQAVKQEQEKQDSAPEQEQNDENTSGDDKNVDLLSILLRANESDDPKKRFTDEELRGQVLTFLTAGHETTSVAVTWTLYHLVKNPEYQNALRKELMEQLPTPDTLPTWDMVNTKMPLLNNVVREAMRLEPPVPITNRVTVEDDKLGGYFIPKNTRVILCTTALHRNPQYWGPDPDAFRPERWDEDTTTSTGTNSASARNFGTWMPFLAGPMNCIGSKFALTEIKVILAVLIRNFEFSESEAEEEKLEKVKRKLRVTLRPSPDLRLVVRRVVE